MPSTLYIFLEGTFSRLLPYGKMHCLSKARKLAFWIKIVLLHVCDVLFFYKIVILHFKLNIVVIDRPPGPLCDLFDEMDALLSCSPDDGTPLIVLGDFSIHHEKLHASEFTNFFSSFDLTLPPCPPIHWTGNQLDLDFTRSCSTFAIFVTPLTVSEHHFVTPPAAIPLSLHSLLCFRIFSNVLWGSLLQCYPPSPPL